jgi:hypothetical protein
VCEDANQVGLRSDLQRSKFALHREDRKDGHAPIQPSYLRGGKDRPVRNSVDHQARDLARSRRQVRRRRQFGAQGGQILSPAQRLAGEKLACGLVQQLDPAILVHGQQRAWGIVDDGRQVTRLARGLHMPRLERLQGGVQRVAKHVEAAAAWIGKALGIILEPDGFDEPGYLEIGAADELPEAGKRGKGNECRHQPAGTKVRHRQ